MTTQVQFSTFNFHNSPVRTITDPKGEIWFCGTDVCNILGYVNPRDAISKHCKVGGVAKRDTPTTSGNQEITFINEPNLYRLIIKSRKPEAERFEAWVFEEVLPQIRKTGSYSQNVEEIRPLEPTYHREHTQTEMLCFASLWFSLYNCRDTLEQVSEPLMALGARLGSTAYTHATEYRNTLGLLQRILVKMLDGIETDEPHYRKALATLRGYQPRGLARIAKR
ncbi:Bro-N domain-containing protein [Haemophilus parahaemolyticus]|uniref:Bro-N domain-containing protein n=1 Tax=Haemophilus parahaemolyticus TaxID=735 RepID=UPI00288A9DFA|nr:Bro-N domain-containing protein [Haemophilus parahaemolyticus]